MADRLFLSNDDEKGYWAQEDIFTWTTPLETSAHGFSAVNVPLVGPMPRNGRVVDIILGVGKPALSASGFVSGLIDANVRINSGATICTTAPAIATASTSATCVRKATNDVTTGVTPAVLGLASAVFSAGDMIEIDYNARSVGSAAAGAAGTGAYLAVVVRYDAA